LGNLLLIQAKETFMKKMNMDLDFSFSGKIQNNEKKRRFLKEELKEKIQLQTTRKIAPFYSF